MGQQNRRRRTGNAGNIMMLRQPVALITKLFGKLGDIDRISEGLRGITPFIDGSEIKHG